MAAQMVAALGQAQSARMKGKFEQQQALMNAQMAELQAQDAVKRGNKEAAGHLKKTRGMVGSQRAAIAAQGIDVSEGSAMDIQTETMEMGIADAQTIRNNARREAFGFRTQSSNYLAQGNFASLASKFEARSTLTAGAVGSLVSGAKMAAGGM